MPSSLHLALYQPDMPQNLGNMLRLCACMGVVAEVIEPCGFPFDEKRMKRAGMDYIEQVTLQRHASWDAFAQWRASTQPSRLILLSAHAAVDYTEFAFQPRDILMVGQESAGVPQMVADQCDAAVKIPMQPGVRCLNVSSAAAIIVSEALRQLRAAV
jgi:tRNA (cytidine/uridine-2'-O-)-methyltransferase